MTAEPVEYTPDEPSPEDIAATTHDALGDTAAAVAVLSDMAPAFLELHDDTQGVLLLNTLRELRQMVASVEAFTEAAMVKRLPYGKSAIPGYIVEVRGGKDRKSWESDRLAYAVTSDIGVMSATGEVDDDAREIVAEVITRLLNCAAISYWRSGQLKPLGIDPDEYCEASKGRKTIAVTPDVGEES